MKLLGILMAVALGVLRTAMAQSFPPPAWQSSPRPAALSDDAVLAVHFRGSALPNGQMWYELDPGPIATRAIRMYSMPSRTRLAMVIDPEYRKSPEGQHWLASLADDVLTEVSFSSGSLPDARPRFQVAAPPESDSWIEVWVNGSYFGADDDRVVANQLLMGQPNFAASVYLRPNDTVQRCCECGTLPDVCTGVLKESVLQLLRLISIL